MAYPVTMLLQSAFADQPYLPAGASANATRACSFEGVTAQLVSLAATTAATTNAAGAGVVRVVCTQAAHFYQGAYGVTGPTAGTGASLLPASSPEYILSGGGKFAFIRDSADGFCYVSDCK